MSSAEISDQTAAELLQALAALDDYRAMHIEELGKQLEEAQRESNARNEMLRSQTEAQRNINADWDDKLSKAQGENVRLENEIEDMKDVFAFICIRLKETRDGNSDAFLNAMWKLYLDGDLGPIVEEPAESCIEVAE